MNKIHMINSTLRNNSVTQSFEISRLKTVMNFIVGPSFWQQMKCCFTHDCMRHLTTFYELLNEVHTLNCSKSIIKCLKALLHKLTEDKVVIWWLNWTTIPESVDAFPLQIKALLIFLRIYTIKWVKVSAAI